MSPTPILDRYETERKAARLNRENAQITALAHKQGQATDRASAGAATEAEREHPIYTPPATAEIPGFEEAAKASAANAPAPSFGQLAELPSNTVKTAEEDAKEAKKNVLGWTDAIAAFFNKILEGSFWLRVLKFILGAVLLILALVFFSKAAGGGGGERAPGVGATSKVGEVATGGAGAAARLAGKAAKGQAQRTRRKQSTVSPARRKAVEEGRKREAALDRSRAVKPGSAAHENTTKRKRKRKR